PTRLAAARASWTSGRALAASAGSAARVSGAAAAVLAPAWSAFGACPGSAGGANRLAAPAARPPDTPSASAGNPPPGGPEAEGGDEHGAARHGPSPETARNGHAGHPKGGSRPRRPGGRMARWAPVLPRAYRGAPYTRLTQPGPTGTRREESSVTL